MDFSAVGQEQIIIGILLIVTVVIIGYLLKMAIKITMIAVIIVGLAYAFTTNPDEITLEHATEWAKSRSEGALENSKDIIMGAKERITDVDIEKAQTLLKESQSALDQIGIKDNGALRGVTDE